MLSLCDIPIQAKSISNKSTHAPNLLGPLTSILKYQIDAFINSYTGVYFEGEFLVYLTKLIHTNTFSLITAITPIKNPGVFVLFES